MLCMMICHAPPSHHFSSAILKECWNHVRTAVNKWKRRHWVSQQATRAVFKPLSHCIRHSHLNHNRKRIISNIRNNLQSRLQKYTVVLNKNPYRSRSDSSVLDTCSCGGWECAALLGWKKKANMIIVCEPDSSNYLVVPNTCQCKTLDQQKSIHNFLNISMPAIENAKI